MRDRMKDREVRQGRERQARHDDRLAADAIGQRPEDEKERRAHEQRARDEQVRRLRVHLERLREEEQGVELPRVPHHRLARREPEQREQHDLEVAPPRERFGERRLRRLALVLHLLEQRRFVQLEPDPHRDAQQDERHQERDPPAPRLELLCTQCGATAEDHEERKEEPQRRRRLDPRRVRTALAVRRMLRHVGGGTAVFTAECQALEQSHRDQEHGRRHADPRVARQQPDDARGHAHDEDRQQERHLPTDEIPDPPEEDGAERPHREAGRKGQQREDECGVGVAHAGEELLADDRRERPVQVEVVPFEHRAQRRREDYASHLAGRQRGGRVRSR